MSTFDHQSNFKIKIGRQIWIPRKKLPKTCYLKKKFQLRQKKYAGSENRTCDAKVLDYSHSQLAIYSSYSNTF